MSANFKQDDEKTTVTVESGGTTKSTGRSLQRFLSQHDPSVPEPAPPPTTKGFETYFLYVASAVALLAVLFAAVLILLD